jgi:hypothetical protein
MAQERSVRHLLLSRVRDRLTQRGLPVDLDLLKQTMAEELAQLAGPADPVPERQRAASASST